jgi:hypothetical protein
MRIREAHFAPLPTLSHSQSAEAVFPSIPHFVLLLLNLCAPSQNCTQANNKRLFRIV